jgi:hypothetical protein
MINRIKALWSEYLLSADRYSVSRRARGRRYAFRALSCTVSISVRILNVSHLSKATTRYFILPVQSNLLPWRMSRNLGAVRLLQDIIAWVYSSLILLFHFDTNFAQCICNNFNTRHVYITYELSRGFDMKIMQHQVQCVLQSFLCTRTRTTT